MAKEQMRPASKEDAPNPARTYERAKPEAEAGMGRMDAPKATPSQRPDRIDDAVGNKQAPRQINAHDTVANPIQNRPLGAQPDHSMKEEEPTDVDLAPQDIKDPKQKRHPRKEGKGGTP